MVRDIILEHPGTDLDVTVEGDAVRVARDYARAVGGSVKGVTRFGTCKVEGGSAGVVDFASTRTETYSRPGALPDVKIVPDIVGDLERRDFAINAMAISLSENCCGVVLDPFDGWGDIGRRQLTVLHPESFTDDPTRILRGIRFAARYGYHFERHTLDFLRACVSAGCMQTISGKRVRRELELIFAEDRVASGIRLLERYGVLRSVARSLSFDARKMKGLPVADRAQRQFRQWTGRDEFDAPTFWFGYLFAGGGSAAQRLAVYLNLDRHAKRTCIWAARDMGKAARDLSILKPPHACKATKLLGALPLESLALLYAASGRRERGIVEDYVTRWRFVKPRLTGADVVKLGVKPGPAVGEMLDKILELRLLGKLRTRSSELAFARREAGVRS